MKRILPITAFCVCLTGLSAGAALAQGTPAAGDYSALSARSAVLSPADKSRAQSIFAAGFSLWQSGDFAAAELAFRQGLDIDPANALANYYYGDCLARRKDKVEARDYLARAVALGNGSVEAFKAQAALQSLSAPVPVAEMDDAQLTEAFVGAWNLVVESDSTKGAFTIAAPQAGQFSVTGHFWVNGIKKVYISKADIRMPAGGMMMTGKLVSPTHIEGFIDGWNGRGSPWHADKQ